MKILKKKSWIDMDYTDDIGATATIFYEGDNIESGLLDKYGNPLIKVKNPIGFYPNKEKE